MSSVNSVTSKESSKNTNINKNLLSLMNDVPVNASDSKSNSSQSGDFNNSKDMIKRDLLQSINNDNFQQFKDKEMILERKLLKKKDFYNRIYEKPDIKYIKLIKNTKDKGSLIIPKVVVFDLSQMSEVEKESYLYVTNYFKDISKNLQNSNEYGDLEKLKKTETEFHEIIFKHYNDEILNSNSYSKQESSKSNKTSFMHYYDQYLHWISETFRNDPLKNFISLEFFCKFFINLPNAEYYYNMIGFDVNLAYYADICYDDVPFLEYLIKKDICANSPIICTVLAMSYEKPRYHSITNSIFIKGFKTMKTLANSDSYDRLEFSYKIFEERMENKILKLIKETKLDKNFVNEYITNKLNEYGNYILEKYSYNSNNKLNINSSCKRDSIGAINNLVGSKRSLRSNQSNYLNSSSKTNHFNNNLNSEKNENQGNISYLLNLNNTMKKENYSKNSNSNNQKISNITNNQYRKSNLDKLFVIEKSQNDKYLYYLNNKNKDNLAKDCYILEEHLSLINDDVQILNSVLYGSSLVHIWLLLKNFLLNNDEHFKKEFEKFEEKFKETKDKNPHSFISLERNDQMVEFFNKRRKNDIETDNRNNFTPLTKKRNNESESITHDNERNIYDSLRNTNGNVSSNLNNTAIINNDRNINRNLTTIGEVSEIGNISSRGPSIAHSIINFDIDSYRNSLYNNSHISKNSGDNSKMNQTNINTLLNQNSTRASLGITHFEEDFVIINGVKYYKEKNNNNNANSNMNNNINNNAYTNTPINHPILIEQELTRLSTQKIFNQIENELLTVEAKYKSKDINFREKQDLIEKLEMNLNTISNVLSNNKDANFGLKEDFAVAKPINLEMLIDSQRGSSIKKPFLERINEVKSKNNSQDSSSNKSINDVQNNREDLESNTQAEMNKTADKLKDLNLSSNSKINSFANINPFCPNNSKINNKGSNYNNIQYNINQEYMTKNRIHNSEHPQDQHFSKVSKDFNNNNAIYITNNEKKYNNNKTTYHTNNSSVNEFSNISKNLFGNKTNIDKVNSVISTNDTKRELFANMKSFDNNNFVSSKLEFDNDKTTKKESNNNQKDSLSSMFQFNK